MTPITVRGIPDEIEKKLRKDSKKKGVSLNKALISLLEKSIGITKEGKRIPFYHDLDHLCGIWEKDEAEVFNKNLELQRKVDEDLWKKRK